MSWYTMKEYWNYDGSSHDLKSTGFINIIVDTLWGNDQDTQSARRQNQDNGMWGLIARGNNSFSARERLERADF